MDDQATNRPDDRDSAVALTQDELTVLSDRSVWEASENAAQSTEKRPRRRLTRIRE